jgi:hypothetical protein
MSDAIDRLEIEVSGGDTKKVEDGLNALAASLGALQRATTQLGKALDGADFDQFGSGVRKLAKALQPLSGFKSQAGGVINSLKDFTETATNFNQFTKFDKFAEQIERLSDSLKPLAGVKTQLGATLKHLSDVPKIMGELEDLNFDEFAIKVRGLADSLEPLGNIQSKLGSTLNQLSRFSQVTQQLDETFTSANFEDNIIRLVSALKPLMEIGKSNLGSILNQLRKIPEIMDSLAKADMSVFADQMERVARAMKPLADEMQKVSQGFSAFPAKIQRLIRDNDRLSNSNRALNRSYGVLGTGISRTTLRFGLLYAGLRRLASRMGDWLNKSNEYVENLHLFRLAMEGATEEALEFAYTVQKKMGIDVSEWMRYQAAFQNMARGFGITEEKASIMSKTLTQLGYDLASVFNVDYETAMRKLESAIAGQPRPMREWGYDISETTLKMVAMNLGIEKNVELMTQMEKAQLRFVQIMKTSRIQGFLGDMARTIMTPANALRVLEQQILQFKRALGEALIPVLIEFIPYVIAGTKVITNMARAIAAMMGFELPEIDYTGLEAIRYGADEATDGLDNTTESLKKLKRQTMGFDELNILSPDTDLEGFNMGIDELGLDLSQYTYDFLGEMDTRIANLTEKIQGMLQPFIDNLPEIWELAKSIGTAFLVWRISNSVFAGLDTVISKLTIIRDHQVVRQGLSLSLIVMGGYLVFDSAFKILYGGASYSTISEAILGAGAVLAGSLFLFGGPTGWVLGPTIILSLSVAGAYFAERAKMKDEVRDAFYGGGDSIMIQDIAVEVVDPDVSLINKFAKLDELMLYAENPSVMTPPNQVRDKLFTLINGMPIPNVVLNLTDMDPTIPEEESDSVRNKLFTLINGTPIPDVVLNLTDMNPTIPEGESDSVRDKLFTLIDGTPIPNVALDLTGMDLKIPEEELDSTVEEINAKFRTITLPDIATGYKAFLDTITDGMDEFNAAHAAFDDLTEKINSTNKEIDNLGVAWSRGLVETADFIPKFNALLDTLNEDLKTRLDLAQENIMTALAGSFGDALMQAGVDLPEFVTTLSEAVNQGKTKVDEMTARLKELNQIILDGGTWTREQAEEWTKLRQELSLTDPAMERAKENFENLNLAIGSIEWGDPETVTAFFKQVNEDTASAIEGVNLFTDNLIAELQAVADMVEDEDIRKAILDSISIADADRDNKIAEINASMGTIFDAMQADMIAKSAVVAQNALTEWNNLKWWEKLFAGSPAGYVDKALQDYQNNIVNPTMERIQESMEQLGIDGELFASDAMKAIMNSLFDYNVSEFGIVTTSFKGTLTEETKALLEQYGIDAHAFAKAAGLDIVEGLEEGVEENLNENWFQRTFGKISTWFENLFKNNSPSKVFKDHGGDLADGLKIGVDEGIKKNDYDNMFTRISDSIKNVFGIKSPSRLMMGYGGDMMDGLAIGVQQGGKNVVSAMKQVANDLKTEGLDPFEEASKQTNLSIQSSYLETIDVVEYEFLDTLKTVIDNWDTLAPWFKDSVFNIISAGSRDLKNSIKENATEGAQGIKDSFQGIPSFFENIMKGEGGVWKTIQDTTSKIAGAFADMALSWAGLGDDFVEKVGNPILRIIADLIREVTRLAAIAAFKWVVSIILTKLGVSPAITKSILAMRDGGFVDQGQMFTAIWKELNVSA